MKIEIPFYEETETLRTVTIEALKQLQEKTNREFIIVNNNDGTCLKAGVHEKIGLWIVKYTDDDEALKGS